MMSFEKEINEYERLRATYQAEVIDKMEREEYRQFNEVLFSTHSCAIEGNSFSVDDTRELKEKGLGMIPAGKTLYEAFEMLDHFQAYEYVLDHIDHPLDEEFLKEVNRRVTLHTIAYRAPDATPGQYTTTDMAAGDTVFGDHGQLVAGCPSCLLPLSAPSLRQRPIPWCLPHASTASTSICIPSATAMAVRGGSSAITSCCACTIRFSSFPPPVARNT